MRRRFTDENWPEDERADFREGNPGASDPLVVTYLPSGLGPLPGDIEIDEDEAEEWRRGG